MLLPTLITIIIILGVIAGYIYYIAPRLNPMNRADNFIDQNMIDEAIIEFKKILDRNPDNFVVHYKLAEVYNKKNEIDRSVLHLEDILKINKFNYQVEKINVHRKLAAAYISRKEIKKAFQIYIDILQIYPGDIESLYHVSFVTLGQEYFSMSQKYFERLMGHGEKDFEILFGAGIASYQNHETNSAVNYCKEALSIEPHSDIANIAITFALQRKMDYKTALNYIKMVVDNSDDQNAIFISKRLQSILYVQAKKSAEGVKVLEELLNYARKNEMIDEISVVLYDLGFASLKAEMTEESYDYWNQLYQHDRGYKNVQGLVTMLRKEMDTKVRPGGDEVEGSVIDYIDDWIDRAFPENFIWDICGLKSEHKFDLKDIIITARVGVGKDDSHTTDSGVDFGDVDSKIEAFEKLDVENFRIISNRVVLKLGYRVDEILPTYREADGVDFLAHSLPDNEKILIWVRRWQESQVGEIPLRNFAQAINDMKAKEGLLITTSELTQSGESALKRLSKVNVIFPEKLGDLLTDLMN